MDAIVTVVGKDQVGIIAGVTHELSQAGINILTISQTILDEYFTMIMKVDLGGMILARQDLNARLETAGMRLGVQITLIHEDVLGICWDARKANLDWDLYRKLIDQFQQVADLMLADYYPLTPYSLDEDAWIAWQFHRPETGEGFVQAFRRSQCATNRRVLRLHGLDPAASYLCTDLDGGPDRVLSGSELAVEITSQPGSALIRYAPVS